MSGDVKVNPENWDEMVKKHQEREEEQLKKVLAKKKAETTEELKTIASNAIVRRALRSGEQKPLKDRKVLTEPASDSVRELRKQLEAEITEVAHRLLFPKKDSSSQ